MRFVSTPVILVLLCATAQAAPDMPQGPTLTLPDGSILQFPPGTHTFGPGETEVPRGTDRPQVIHPAPPPAPSAPLSAAERRRQRLDELYGQLAQARDPIEAQAVGAMIADVFLHSGSDTADLIMQRAVTAMEAKDYATAGALLDKLVVLRPRWAEAWNKRATVRYLEDDDVGSMADIGQVLLLEPRHFGALNGMGLILHRNGDDKGALTVLRKAQAISPQDEQLKALIDQLAPDVEGHEL